jgi:spermidine synthase
VGIAIRKHPKWLSLKKSSVYDSGNAMKVGVIGLGIGTIAAYCNRGDVYRFYEINPAVDALARSYFSYLSSALGKIEVILGDGRISLERELEETGPMDYDVLVVDAFSGDAVPIHLLTREAFELYWRHLRPDGVLALNISNRHINLKSVARGLARIMNKKAVLIKNRRNSKYGINKSTWVLISSNPAFMNKAAGYSKKWPEGGPEEVIWTDDYSNLIQLLKY